MITLAGEMYLYKREHLEEYIKEEKLNKIFDYITNTYWSGIQIFFTSNSVGDKVQLVKAIDDVDIYYCEDYEYLEIFGLTEDEEFEFNLNELNEFYFNVNTKKI